jgi:hypothetical protein
MLTEDYGLFYSATTAYANEVAALLDSAEQGVREVAVVDELVAQKLQRSAEN